MVRRGKDYNQTLCGSWSDHRKVISGRSHLQLIFSAELEKLDNLYINSLFSSAPPPTSTTAVHHLQREEGKLDSQVAPMCE